MISHAQALLSGRGVAAIRGDLADPAAIVDGLRVEHLLDLAEPVVVILAMMLHFFDVAIAHDIVAAFARTVAASSYFVVMVGSGDEHTGAALARKYQAGTLHNHFAAQIATFLKDQELIPPGVTDAMAWIPVHPPVPACADRRAHPGNRRQKARARNPNVSAPTTERTDPAPRRLSRRCQ